MTQEPTIVSSRSSGPGARSGQSAGGCGCAGSTRSHRFPYRS
jgi:hypothetical protein